jgi:hypothetical protein
MRAVWRVSEDQRQDADHDQQADDEDDAGGAADELEHVCLLFVTQDNRKGALLFPGTGRAVQENRMIMRENGERLDNDPCGTRYGCFLPDLTDLARRLPAPTSRAHR